NPARVTHGAAFLGQVEQGIPTSSSTATQFTRKFKRDIGSMTGSLVLLKEDNCPPLYWPIGRIVQVHPGADGAVRVVTVRTQKGVFKRAITKIC
ncbi:hypothetical protein YQE_00374, partial [Dendroctonus ponderosae]